MARSELRSLSARSLVLLESSRSSRRKRFVVCAAMEPSPEEAEEILSQRRSTVNGEAPRDVLVADPDSSRCGAATTAGALHRTHRLLRPSIVGGPSPQVPTLIALVALARVADASRAHLAGRLGRHWSPDGAVRRATNGLRSSFSGLADLVSALGHCVDLLPGGRSIRAHHLG